MADEEDWECEVHEDGNEFEMMDIIGLNGKSILVTGATGFIGCYLMLRLYKEMSEGFIVGLDNMIIMMGR